MKSIATSGGRILPQPPVPGVLGAEPSFRRGSAALLPVRLEQLPVLESPARNGTAFDSFWIAGYEGADHLVDMCQVTQHHAQAAADYANIVRPGRPRAARFLAVCVSLRSPR